MQSNHTQVDLQKLHAQFCQYTGMENQALLAQISPSLPSGEFLKANGVYSSIKHARSADDPNLPQGDWQHNLKIADWQQVTEIATDALATKTKDLQLAIWLLEAQIYRFGMAGVAPVVQFITEMTEKFWDDLHPQIEDQDLGYRSNLIAWMNEKLQPALRQLAITDSRSEKQYCWADWEMAIRLEQHRDEAGGKDEYVSSQTILHAMTTTPIDVYRQFYQDCSQAIVCLEQFNALLESKYPSDPPSISGFKELILEMRETIAAQVKHRGLFASAKQDNDEQEPEPDTGQQSSGGGDGSASRLDSREKAYSQLAEAAEYLMQDDPHSPVPYLVFKAIEWGNLNTAELYQELFVQYQGQLNIFDILGLELEKKEGR